MRNPTSADIPRQTVCALAVVVAQLVERSLPTPEVRGSKPVIGKFYMEHLLSTATKRRKEKKKRPRKSHLKNQIAVLQNFAKSVRFISTLVFSFGRYDLANRSTFWQCITL